MATTTQENAKKCSHELQTGIIIYHVFIQLLYCEIVSVLSWNLIYRQIPLSETWNLCPGIGQSKFLFHS